MPAPALALHRARLLARGRVAVALLLPLIALGLQHAVWPVVRPFAWFLFYPAVFASSWLGGLRVGLTATAVSALLAWYWFIPPLTIWLKPDAKGLLSVLMFMAMGTLFSVFNGRLRRTNQQLHAVNAEVTRLYERTLELDELKTQFFANVSHELRTPLTLVLGPAERLLAQVETTDRARVDLQVIVRNARALLRRVSELLDASKLEAGEMRPAYMDMNLARLTRLTASQFETIAEERRLTFAVQAPPELRAQVDPEQMMRVLLNLLSNAFKFTPEGGHVRVTIREAGDRVHLEVADSGPGIPADMREAVFERFRQMEGGANRAHGGTGLGLAIARDLVHLHAGRLTVAQAPEGGALFLVDVPRTAPAGRTVAPEVSARTPATVEYAVADDLVVQPKTVPDVAAALLTQAGAASGGLVLVVEDNPDMNHFLCESLQQDYRVAAAFDGKEGLRLALELAPDLVLTDAMMPGVGGEQMVTAIRRERALDTTPVLMLTAKADDRFRVQMLRSGAQDFMIKPFQIEELSARTANLISAKRALDARARLVALVESTDDAIIMLSLDGKVLAWNPAAVRIFGYSADEMMGQDLFRIVPAELLAEASDLLGLIRRGERVQTKQTVRVRKDGSTVPIAFTLSPVIGATGAAVAASAIARDITEVQRAAAERERLISELQGALANVRTLSGLLPICAWCKKVRDDAGYWKQIEAYVTEHTAATFSHGVCPECQAKIEAEIADKKVV